jgi:hypothetical protein
MRRAQDEQNSGSGPHSGPVDVQRLVQIIIEELAAASPMLAGAAGAPAHCACHALLYECCPDRLQGVLQAGATRLGLHASGGGAGGVASMIRRGSPRARGCCGVRR